MFDDIITPIFRKYGITTLSQIQDDTADGKKLVSEIKRIFWHTQAAVITVEKVKTTYELHHRGDEIRDQNGDPIPTSDGKGYKTYTKDVTEAVRKVERVPMYSLQNVQTQKELDKAISTAVVYPDYEELRKKTCARIDYDRALEIIGEFQKWYVFAEPHKFAERFSLVISNAKAKALGYHPMYPVWFSLVGHNNMGKGKLAEVILKTHDRVFSTKSSESSIRNLLGETFNSVMLTRGFIHIDEADGADAAKCEQLKSTITEKTVSVRRMFKERQDFKNLVTFFSTTNESIKDIMGLQEDRRIAELQLVSKNGKMPEERMMELMEELWMVSPVFHPHAERIVNELLDESNEVLDTTMTEIVVQICREHLTEGTRLEDMSFDFTPKGSCLVHMTTLKKAIQTKAIGRTKSIINWMKDRGILRTYSHGSTSLDKTELKKWIDRQLESEHKYADNCLTSGGCPSDIDDLLTLSPQRSGTSTLKDVALGKMNELLGRNDISDEVKNAISANKKKLEEVARMFSNEMEVK